MHRRANRHGDDKDQSAGHAVAERGEGWAWTVADQPPTRPEQGRASDQPRVNGHARWLREVWREQRSAGAPPQDQTKCGRRDGCRHDEGEAGIPVPGDIEECLYLQRIYHVGDNKAKAEQRTGHQRGDVPAHR